MGKKAGMAMSTSTGPQKDTLTVFFPECFLAYYIITTYQKFGDIACSYFWIFEWCDLWDPVIYYSLINMRQLQILYN